MQSPVPMLEKPKRDFGFLSLAQSFREPEPEHDTDMLGPAQLSKSPVKKHNFGFLALLLEPLEPGLGISTPAQLPPLPAKKHDFGFVALASQKLDSEVDIVMKDPSSSDTVRAASPLPGAENTGAIDVPEEGPSEMDADRPTEANDPIGSSSEARCEFQFSTSYIYLTLGHAAWKWGTRPPSPRKGKSKGRPGATHQGEVEREYELVC